MPKIYKTYCKRQTRIVLSSVWERAIATDEAGLGNSPGRASDNHDVISATEKLPDTRNSLHVLDTKKHCHKRQTRQVNEAATFS